MERPNEERRKIIWEILDEYRTRKGTQEELAVKFNEKYGTTLTAKDVGNITQQDGYYHTVLRNTLTTVLIKLDDTTKKNLG